MIFPWNKSSTGIICMSNLSAWPHTAGKWLFLSRRLCGIKAWKGLFDNASTPSYVPETENIREREAPGSAESIPFSMSLCHLQLHHRAWANVLCISVCVCQCVRTWACVCQCVFVRARGRSPRVWALYASACLDGLGTDVGGRHFQRRGCQRPSVASCDVCLCRVREIESSHE